MSFYDHTGLINIKKDGTLAENHAALCITLRYVLMEEFGICMICHQSVKSHTGDNRDKCPDVFGSKFTDRKKHRLERIEKALSLIEELEAM